MKVLFALCGVVSTAAAGSMGAVQGAGRWLGAAAPTAYSGAVVGRALLLRGGADPIAVTAVLKGKDYDVSAATVADVWAAVEEAAGLEASRVGVMFKGAKLADGEQLLSDAGVSEGDKLNIVPGRAARSSPSDDKAAAGAAAAPFAAGDSDDEDEAVAAPASVGGGGAAGAMSSALASMSDDDKAEMDKMLEQMGGKEGMQSMLKQMGLDGPMTPDKIEGLMGQVKAMLANPAITAMFENPEILEQSRQQILSNPMLMKAYDGMGMGALIRDPAAFRSQMEGMKSMLENPELLQKAMSGLSEASKVDEFDQGDL